MPYDTQDVFAGGTKTPSLSWKGLPVGTIFTLEVLEAPKLLQSRDFDSGELAYWDEAKQQPKMSAVVNVRVLTGPHSIGEERSIWAQKPSSLFQAIAAAQATAGQLLAAGGTLALRFAGEKPHENKRFNAIKMYEARYEPPKPFDFPAPPVTRPATPAAPVSPPSNPAMVGWANPQGAATPPPTKPTW